MLNRHDLVIKEADTGDTPETGFHAFDMDLLRKCPCPVWLCRPFRHEAPRLKIATAIDPDNEGPAGRALSLRLLQLGASLATLYGVPLHVVSCWDFPMENYLRHSTWVTLPDHELTDMILHTQTRHDRAMRNLIREAGIEPAGLESHHIRGPAAQAIPRLVAEGYVDILIMGTVARTGIPGFIIGNTAEDILRKVDCTLVALKPDGFVTAGQSLTRSGVARPEPRQTHRTVPARHRHALRHAVEWGKPPTLPDRLMSASTDFHLITAVSLAVLLVFVTVLVHYEALRLISGLLPRLRMPPRSRVLAIIYAIFVVHLLEIGLFSTAYWLLCRDPALGGLAGHISGNYSDYLYFSATVYTSVGFGDVYPQLYVRLLSALEGLMGLVMIGWSASFTYLMMEKLWADHPRRRQK